MQTKNITVRIPADMYAQMQKDEEKGSISQQLVDAVRKCETIRKLSTEELRGKFTPGEWSLLADNLNGSIISDELRYRAGLLVAHVEDGNLYDRLGEKWGVDMDALTEKLYSLTAAQVDALYTRVERFWQSTGVDLQEWAKF